MYSEANFSKALHWVFLSVPSLSLQLFIKFMPVSRFQHHRSSCDGEKEKRCKVYKSLLVNNISFIQADKYVFTY